MMMKEIVIILNLLFIIVKSEIGASSYMKVELLPIVATDSRSSPSTPVYLLANADSTSPPIEADCTEGELIIEKEICTCRGLYCQQGEFCVKGLCKQGGSPPSTPVYPLANADSTSSPIEPECTEGELIIEKGICTCRGQYCQQGEFCVKGLCKEECTEGELIIEKEICTCRGLYCQQGEFCVKGLCKQEVLVSFAHREEEDLMKTDGLSAEHNGSDGSGRSSKISVGDGPKTPLGVPKIERGSNKYTKVADGSPCALPLSGIQQLRDCYKAAAKLNLEWGGIFNGPGDFPGCLYAHNGRKAVYYNINPKPNIYGINPKYEAICIRK